jgi:hypothetical protein
MGYAWFEPAMALLRALGIAEYEVQQVLNGRKLPLGATLPTGLPVVAMIGRTRLGRVLVVIVRPGWPDSQILHVREATDDELAALVEWETEQDAEGER